MKTLMILGASILQIPAILKAKEMGLQVIAVDMDKNAVGFQHADICLDISTIDIPKVVHAAQKYKIDGIMTLASDMPMRTVAAVAKELNIVGISEETALNATNKGMMRECLKQYNIPIPLFFKVNTKEEYINAIKQFDDKCIVKPADNSGSRGVYLISNIKDKKTIHHAYKYSKRYSRSGEIMVEEYMEGPEVSVEALSVEGEVHGIAVTNKLTLGAPKFVEMGHSQPSLLPREIEKEVTMIATDAIKAIGIENGPSHTEIIITKEGPKIVELGARLGGDNIATHLVPLSTGVDMVKCCIDIALNNKPEFGGKIRKGSAIRYFMTSAGRITDISGIDKAQKIPGVKQITFIKNIGDVIYDINSSSDRIGFVIAQSESANEAISVCEEVLSKIEIDID